MPPQTYQKVLIILSIGVDIMIMVMLLIYLANLTIQQLTMFKLMNFISQNNWRRVMFYILVIALSVSYIHEVFFMLIYLWALPAFKMT